MYTHDTGLKGGSRFYLKYSGSAPSGANCVSIATAVRLNWYNDMRGLLNADWTLTETDVLDIATHSGFSGTYASSDAGDASGTACAAQIAQNVEFGISRRYRGGKPRMYLPPSVTSNQLNDVQWTSTWTSTLGATVAAFMSDNEAISVGSVGTLTHVNVSYYQGFQNIENTSGRMRAAPTYRTTAVVDTVTGYFGKQELSSQRRRRVSTTP